MADEKPLSQEERLAARLAAHEMLLIGLLMSAIPSTEEGLQQLKMQKTGATERDKNSPSQKLMKEYFNDIVDQAIVFLRKAKEAE